MKETDAKKILSAVLSFILVTVPPQFGYGYQAPGSAPANGAGNPTEGTPRSASELQALVAPIALYPDALVAQILAAATFPDQVAIANYWLQQNKNLTGSSLMQAVDKQTWDPSVKALTQFSTVLSNMSSNLTWTSSLGEAYHDQSANVMTAVQTLRAQAKAKGNLKSTSQLTVVEQSPQTIVIQSANPQVVYVPQYDPAVIYGYPYMVPSYVAPAYSTGDLVAAGVLSFGAGIAVGAMPATIPTAVSPAAAPAAHHTRSTSTVIASTPIAPRDPIHGHSTTVRAPGNQPLLAVWTATPADSADPAAGLREPTAVAAGGACGPAASVAGDSEAVAALVAAAFDVDLDRDLH